MVVMTAKLSKKKLLGILAVVAAGILLLSCCMKGDGGAASGDDTAMENDDRIAFLSSFGYTVNGEPTQTQQIRIPEAGSEVFDRYNALQQSQGYDLSGFAGQTVTRYVYKIENYDDTGTEWFATLLVSDGQIIGGDVASSDPEGPMHGFARS
ncbi:MAG: DUF4830 domain-containing protein [Ruminococcaceae bacterium]|nr:DUF4830 domain-containing protein [Oscillospiraceae bacterium]